MTKDEALRLALETLEYAGPSWIEARQPAITAIKAALEAKDESVAYLSPTELPENYCYILPQRTWVGLTDEDLDYLCHLAYTGDEEFALAVQAKLKELNV